MRTTKLADKFGLRAESIRARVAAHGDYFGVRPIKLLNGQWCWPEDAVERLMHAPPSEELGQERR